MSYVWLLCSFTDFEGISNNVVVYRSVRKALKQHHNVVWKRIDRDIYRADCTDTSHLRLMRTRIME